MSDNKLEEIMLESEKWAEGRLNELFEVEKFKAINKEDDHLFQALSFMGEASQKLSVANTILRREDNLIKHTDTLEQLSNLQQELHDLTDYVRKFRK